jgi:hypothetical protein
MRNSYKILDEKPKSRPFRKIRCRWDNIRMDVKVIGCVDGCDLHLSGLRYEPVASSCQSGNEISASIKVLCSMKSA